MRPLSAVQVLALWDAGQTRHPIDRSLLALALAMPEEAPDELADRPVGWREINMLALRNATFGSALDGYAPCPSCGNLMEFGLDGVTLLQSLPAPDTAVEWLPDRCRVDDIQSGMTSTVDRKKSPKSKCSPARIGEIESRMEALDPAADIRLGMRCSDCGHAWDAVLDVGNCFWDELGIRARQLLESVHRLASAYGWREAEILALSPARRAAYLNMIG